MKTIPRTFRVCQHLCARGQPSPGPIFKVILLASYIKRKQCPKFRLSKNTQYEARAEIVRKLSLSIDARASVLRHLIEVIYLEDLQIGFLSNGRGWYV
jgi:hypothetical protein